MSHARTAGKRVVSKILPRLSSSLDIEPSRFAALHLASKHADTFQLLLGTVLSQNTNDRNALAAFERLSGIVGTSPEAISGAPFSKIRNAIRPAGMFNVRAKRIKELARCILEKHDGDLSWIRALPLENARSMILDLPQVGPKTADVLLLFVGHKRTFPIDTHISRVSRRLHIITDQDNYEQARKKLMKAFPPSRYLQAHLLLIEHGRRTCRARRPLCGACPLQDLCPFPRKHPEFLSINDR